MNHKIGRIFDYRDKGFNDKYFIKCNKKGYKLVVEFNQLGGIEFCPYCGDILDYSPNIQKALKELKEGN